MSPFEWMVTQALKSHDEVMFRLDLKNFVRRF